VGAWVKFSPCVGLLFIFLVSRAHEKHGLMISTPKTCLVVMVINFLGGNLGHFSPTGKFYPFFLPQNRFSVGRFRP